MATGSTCHVVSAPCRSKQSQMLGRALLFLLCPLVCKGRFSIRLQSPRSAKTRGVPWFHQIMQIRHAILKEVWNIAQKWIPVALQVSFPDWRCRPYVVCWVRVCSNMPQNSRIAHLQTIQNGGIMHDHAVVAFFDRFEFLDSLLSLTQSLWRSWTGFLNRHCLWDIRSLESLCDILFDHLILERGQLVSWNTPFWHGEKARRVRPETRDSCRTDVRGSSREKTLVLYLFSFNWNWWKTSQVHEVNRTSLPDSLPIWRCPVQCWHPTAAISSLCKKD